jgi:two-component system response regulator MtrA
MTNLYEILIVDDDVQMLDMVELVLKREGYDVLRAMSAQKALEILTNSTPDLFVIDAIMPDTDGVALCHKIRQTEDTASIPIIFLTGHNTRLGVVEALNSGADDYLRKPFNPRELAARVRSLIRRSAQYTEPDAPLLRLVPAEYRVLVGERDLVLTPMEFELLKYLALTPYHPHSAEELLTHVWHYPDGVGDAALVRNHVHNIRRKIEHDPERPEILQSRHGRGYIVKAKAHVEPQNSTQIS